MRIIVAMLSVGLVSVALGACGAGGAARRPAAGEVGGSNGPSRPYAAELERPIDVGNLTMMLRWVGARYDEAALGDRRRVRVPLIRRAANNQDDSPEWAIAAGPKQGPFQWVAVVGAINGIPAGDWRGWAEGSFTGREIEYRSRDTGVTMMLPVLELARVAARGDEAAVVTTFAR